MMGPYLRGYSDGKYRVNQRHTAQAEYRRKFHGRWGLVGFGGFGGVTEKLRDIRFDDILPSVGSGLRSAVIQEWQVNAGMNIAAGKDEVALCFRVDEAF